MFVIHVDNILAAGKTAEITNEFGAELGSILEIKDLGDVRFYMGCHITRNR